ncbi:ANTAR domain-containing response regulator [Desulfitobacterium metallireducens]|uniref:Stage 0 sporulation protein A homolog n=1 Tax=Desulfitobacterium metallireducens DSM 15288 TaxID=871968 RepID=W0ECI0_9FIRM|nr:ANTAR domain-containing protein [Desulfitobacterium metallireducens]AHF06914.1 response regulator [Desulfitobacterium metallireducens DSM 15288]
MKRALIIGNSRQISELKTIIPLADYQAIATTSNGIEGLRLLHRFEPDLVIMTWNILGLSTFDLLQNIVSQRLCPVMVVISQEDISALPEIVKLNPHYVLVQPLRAFDLITGVLYIEHLFLQEQETLKKITRLENDLKLRKVHYQALLMLIQEKGYDEKTAYRKMQQYAMSKRKTLYSVAMEIIKGNWLPE